MTSSRPPEQRREGEEGKEEGAYAASFGQRVAAVSRKCAFARLLQLVVASILDDGFKSRLHAKIEHRMLSGNSGLVRGVAQKVAVGLMRKRRELTSDRIVVSYEGWYFSFS